MEELGYIEPEEFERLKDRLEEWLNIQCGSLALFYIKARQNGLVPADEVNDDIPKQVRKVKKGTTIPKDSTIMNKFINFLRRGTNSE